MNEWSAREITETVPFKVELPLKLYLERRHEIVLDLLEIHTFSTHS